MRDSNQKPLSEMEFIEQKKEELKLAIQQTVQRLKMNAGNTMEVSPWVEKFPWAAVGTAFAAGLITSGGLIPDLVRNLTQEQQAPELAPVPATATVPQKLPATQAFLLPTLSSFLTGTAVAIFRDLMEKHYQETSRPPLEPR